MTKRKIRVTKGKVSIRDNGSPMPCNLCDEVATHRIQRISGRPSTETPLFTIAADITDVVCEFHAYAVKESDFNKSGMGGLKHILYGQPRKRDKPLPKHLIRPEVMKKK